MTQMAPRTDSHRLSYVGDPVGRTNALSDS